MFGCLIFLRKISSSISFITFYGAKTRPKASFFDDLRFLTPKAQFLEEIVLFLAIDKIYIPLGYLQFSVTEVIMNDLQCYNRILLGLV